MAGEDDIQRSLGELKGMVSANHTEMLSRLGSVETKVENLHNLHQRLKGAMALIALLASASFHAVLEGVKNATK